MRMSESPCTRKLSNDPGRAPAGATVQHRWAPPPPQISSQGRAVGAQGPRGALLLARCSRPRRGGRLPAPGRERAARRGALSPSQLKPSLGLPTAGSGDTTGRWTADSRHYSRSKKPARRAPPPRGPASATPRRAAAAAPSHHQPTSTTGRRTRSALAPGGGGSGGAGCKRHRRLPACRRTGQQQRQPADWVLVGWLFVCLLPCFVSGPEKASAAAAASSSSSSSSSSTR